MGKGGGAKAEVTRYYMGQHFGVCTGADAVLAIIVKEKLAWSGEVSTQSQIRIEKDQLFGGRLKEGGVEAIVYWLPGASTQVLDDHLARRLGKASGAEVPGYRGIASAFFVGAKDTGQANFAGGTSPRYGAYWSANNPYLPGVWIKVRRAPVGLDPDYALVPASTELPVITGEVELTWWQRSLDQTVLSHEDAGRMGVSFLNEQGAQIGSTTWSSFADFLSWTQRTLNAGDCPAGTVTIRIHMSGDREWGSYCDAYFDDIEVTLDGVPLTLINLDAETGDTTGWVSTASTWRALTIDQDGGLPHGGTYMFAGGTHSSPAAHQDYGTAIPGFDANPAHIIYEALTNTDWGMGSPTTAIDMPGFEAVAVTLYFEGFGLSLIWTRQSSIQDFIQEVLDHINAVLYVDPATGLLTIKLIRGDYDSETLDELTPDIADLTSFHRKLWGEITNEIIVSWTNPETEQEETTPPAQDLASIAIQGLISDSRNYYGVRNASLAMRLAWRELRASGTPLATCEAEVDRSQWNLRPASVIKLTWPEYGLAGVVMRVTSIDYGRPGDPTIKLALIEDVFGLDFGAYEEPPSSGWVDPSEAPEPLTIERIFTLPLFFAANSPAAEFVDTPAYPEVVAGILATTTQEDAYGYDLWDEVTLSNGSLEWQEIAADMNIIGHATLTGALVAEADTIDVEFENLIGGTAPVVAGFVIIGDDGEEGNEIAQIDAIDEVYGLVILRRGMLDTVPRAWPAGTPVWFVDEETLYEDPTVRAAGETMDVKLLTKTSQGVLALGDAALVSHDLTERPWLPNRPANVTIDGVLFNTANQPVDMIGETEVPVTWANRNRLLEDAQVLGWTDATVTPETGQTTTIKVYAEDGTTLVDTITGLSGTSHNIPIASFEGEAIGLVTVWAERSDDDGDFTSLQGHGIWVQVAEGNMITEEGDNPITEDGDELIYEG